MGFIVKKLWQRHKPRLIIFVGAYGKSMAIAATATILKSQGKTCAVVEHAPSVEDAVAAQGQNRWRWRAVLQWLGMAPYPEYLLIEMSESDVRLTEEWNALVVMTGPTKSDFPYAHALIYNADAIELKEDKKKSTPRLSYGIDRVTDYQAEFLELIAVDDAKLTGGTDPRWRGMQAKIKHKGSVLPLRLSGGLGRAHVYAALAAVAITAENNIHVLESLKSLREATPLPGRMTLVPAIKKSLIVDDSYTMEAGVPLLAFEETASIPVAKGQRRIAVVGEFIGVGSDSAEQHATLGRALAELGYELVVGVGERATDVLHGAELAGLPRERLFHFADPIEAGKFVQRELKRGEIIVVKGSVSSKLERVVKELMAFPLRAKQDILQR